MSGAGPSPLAGLLPGRERTLFLRACTGQPGAWEQWGALVGDPAAALSAGGSPTRSLSPMLQWGLRSAGADPGPQLRVALRAAASRERERTKTMWSGVAEVLRELQCAGVDATLIGEVAVAQSAYPAPGVRHCHGLQLLIGERERSAAFAALRRRGGSDPVRTDSSAHVVSHPLGAPVLLRERLLAARGIRVPLAELTGRRRLLDVAGARVPAPAADDLLLSVVASGLCDSPGGSLQWAADGHQIVEREGAGLDWERLTTTARESRLSRVIATGVAYLARKLGTDIPPSALAQVEAAVDRQGEDLARVIAIRELRRTGAWRRRALRPRNALALARSAPGYARAKAPRRKW